MRSVVVTGASTGIGWATSKMLIDRGCRVFGSVRKQADADRLKAEFGANFTPLLFDVTDAPAVLAAAEKCARRSMAGRWPALSTMPALRSQVPCWSSSADEFRRQMDVNVVGPVIATQAFGPLLGADPALKGPKGRIVTISSVAGKNGNRLMAPYCASKHAIEGLSESLGRELMLYGIDVVIVAPGAVRTPIWSKAEQVDLSVCRNSPYFPALNKLSAFVTKLGGGRPAGREDRRDRGRGAHHGEAQGALPGHAGPDAVHDAGDAAQARGRPHHRQAPRAAAARRGQLNW